jgi:surface antigen
MAARPIVFVACLALAAPLLAHASGLAFMGRGPMAKFSKEDHDLFRGALNRALTTDKLDQAIAWNNPKTPAKGSITPHKIHERDGAPCRTLRVVNEYQTLQSDGVYTLCKRDGSWKLATS